MWQVKLQSCNKEHLFMWDIRSHQGSGTCHPSFFWSRTPHRYLNAGMQQQQFCFQCFSYSSQPPFSRRKSHRTAMPRQDTKVSSLCVPGAKGKKKKKPKLLGADSCGFVRLASSHKATKAVILEVKYHELPECPEPKPTQHLISRKSLLQHLRMSL